MPGTFNPGGLNAPPKSIINAASSGGLGFAQSIAPTFDAKKTLSGALTANTYKEIVSVSGPGVISMAAVFTVDATSRAMGIKVVIDGITIFDAASAAEAYANCLMVAIGYITRNDAAGFLASEKIPFNSSLSVSIKSSLAETDKIALLCKYYTT